MRRTDSKDSTDTIATTLSTKTTKIRNSIRHLESSEDEVNHHLNKTKIINNNNDNIIINNNNNNNDDNNNHEEFIEQGRRRSNNNDNHDESQQKSPLQKTKTKKNNKNNLKNYLHSWSTIISSFSSGHDLESKDQQRAWRVAMLLFVSLIIHNFPEGLAVAASALESQKLGITVTIGIMIHNIPEGIAIAIPCLAARPNSPWLSFALASISGLAEPFGALVALFFLHDMKHTTINTVNTTEDFISTMICIENVLAFVAGIMITVSICELYPEGYRHASMENHQQSHLYFVSGTVCGIFIMVATELYLP